METSRFHPPIAAILPLWRVKGIVGVVRTGIASFRNTQWRVAMLGPVAKTSASFAVLRARFDPVRFVRREDGTITAFALMIFVLMVGVGGIAIDVMRYETQRAQLQYTLDRAVLAAASLTQPYDPEGVVRDYFDVSGLEDYRLDIRVENGLNYRRVHAYAEMEINSLFMQMFGVRTMTSPAAGAAEERVRNIEISMVLDISGSMASSNRMTNMRPAAREFVTSVLAPNYNPDGDNLVSVSIIPYNGRVNARGPIESVFTLSNEHTESACTRFTYADFRTTAITPTQTIQRLAHFDYDNRGSTQEFEDPHCQTGSYAAILPWQHTEAPLHALIDSLQPEGWTAIDLGVNWGVGLLDPAAGPALNALIDQGLVDNDFDERPAAYDDDESMKVLVLMTDGENTNQYDIVQAYKSGNSPIYYHAGDNRYSIWWADRGQYWIPSGSPTSYSGYWSNSPYRTTESVALSWPYLWGEYTARYIAETYLRVPANQSGQWNFYNSIRYYSSELYAGESTANSNLRAICDAARAQGIIVFAIGFEAPSGGQSEMRYCATSAAHYYDVEGLEISEAFASIARTINQLRLIQ